MGDTDLMHLNIVADITSPGSAHTRLVLLVQFLFVFAILSYIFSLSLSLSIGLPELKGATSFIRGAFEKKKKKKKTHAHSV